jgi:hypothetical protein
MREITIYISLTVNDDEVTEIRKSLEPLKLDEYFRSQGARSVDVCNTCIQTNAEVLPPPHA